MADAAPAAGDAAPEYYQVTLSRSVFLYNFNYRPGVIHTVDKATLDAFGDAVVVKTPVKG